MKRILNDPHDRIAALLIVAGSLLRIYNYCGWSLSNDELSALVRLQFDGLGNMILHGVQLNDMHPMGVQVFLWFWTHLFGVGECALRLPFVLMGCGSLMLLYRVASLWFNKAAALWALALFSALQFPILYSQLARPYSAGLFFVLLTAYAWTKIVWNQNNGTAKRFYVLYTVAMAASMYTHYFAFLEVAIMGLAGLFVLPRKAWMPYLLCGLAAFLLYIPNYSVFLAQFAVGGLGGDGGWLGKPSPDAIHSYLFYAFNSSKWLMWTITFTVIFLAIKFRKSGDYRNRRILALTFGMLPVLIAYFYSVYGNPVFQFSILLFGFPFLVIWVFSFVPEQADRQWLYPIAIMLCLFTAGDTIFAREFYTTQHFGVFKDLAERIKEIDDKYGKDQVAKTVNVINPYYIHYYSDQLCPEAKFLQYRCNQVADYRALEKIVAQSKEPYFLHAWSNNYHAPETDLIIREQFPYLIASYDYFNSGVKLYGRKQEAAEIGTYKRYFTEENTFESNRWKNDSILRTSETAAAGLYAIRIDSTMEFAADFVSTAGAMKLKNGRSVAASFLAKGNGTELSWVFSVERGDQSLLWRAQSLAEYGVNDSSWTKVYFGYNLTEQFQDDDVVKCYFYNVKRVNACIDNFKLEVAGTE